MSRKNTTASHFMFTGCAAVAISLASATTASAGTTGGWCGVPFDQHDTRRGAYVNTSTDLASASAGAQSNTATAPTPRPETPVWALEPNTQFNWHVFLNMMLQLLT